MPCSVALWASGQQPLGCLGAVDDRVVRAEGESYETAAGWRSAHERFWREEVSPDWERHVPVLDESTPVVVEWFRLRERV
jgi:uncharacterized protein YhfF